MKDALLIRYSIFLIAVFSGIFLAQDQGLIRLILSSDQSYISEAIVVLWIIGMGMCSYRIIEANRWLDVGIGYRRKEFEVVSQRHWGPIDIIGRLLFRLGLVGTVYGFWVALSGLDLEHLTDNATIAQEIGILMGGMQIAIVTTLVGAVTNIILVMGLRFLEGAYQKILAEEYL